MRVVLFISHSAMILLHIAEIVLCCCLVSLFNLFWLLDCDTVPGDLLLSCCSVARCRCYSCDNCCICCICNDCFGCDTVPSVLRLYLVCCYDCDTVPSVLLFCCFADSIPMIIVKKIQNPNIFFTFSKKYYHCHIYHIISADLP